MCGIITFNRSNYGILQTFTDVFAAASICEVKTVLNENKEIFYIKYDDDTKGELVIGEDPKGNSTSKIKYYRKDIDNHQWRVKMNSVECVFQQDV